MDDSEIKEYVRKTYSEIAKTGDSCCPSSCCGPSAVDLALKSGYSAADLKEVPESSVMGLGCGNPIALASLKEGDIVLDLGSGGGIDVFMAARRVGAHGKAIGVDMTEDMVLRGRSAASQYGYENVEFRLGEIESLPVEDSSVDVIISNCVINLSPDKEKVFQEAYRVLKPGGRITISDLVTYGELPGVVKRSFSAWAGCVGGALEKDRYLDAIVRAGFGDVRVLSESACDLGVPPQLKGKIASVQVEAHKS